MTNVQKSLYKNQEDRKSISVVRIVLFVGLILSSIAAIAASLRIIFAFVHGTTWFWEGALAAYAGPVFFALALYLDEKRLCDQLDRWIAHTAIEQAAKAQDDGSVADA